MLCLLWGQGAQAGLISAITKAAKKVDAPSASFNKLPDGGWQHLDLGFADGIEPNLLRVKLDADRKWVLSDGAGNIVDDISQVENPAVVIDRAHLPDRLSQLDSLPVGAPILLTSNDTLFQLVKQDEWAVRVGGASIKANTPSGLKSAVAHLERPWANGPVRILGLKDEAANSMSLRRGVDLKTLQNSPAQLRGQTIALSGSIRNNHIRVAGKRVSLTDLRRTADEFDISLVVLETRGNASPKALLKQLDDNMVDGVPQNTGHFLGKLHEPGMQMEYSINPTSKNQVVVRQKTEAAGVEANATDLESVIAAHAIVRVAIYRPNEERAQELEDRLVWWLPTWMLGYMIVSLVTGLVFAGTSADVFYKFWPTSGTQHWLLRPMEIGFSLIMLGIFMMFLGLPLAIGKLIWMICKAIWWTLVLIIALLMDLVNLLLRPFRRGEETGEKSL